PAHRVDVSGSAQRACHVERSGVEAEDYAGSKSDGPAGRAASSRVEIQLRDLHVHRAGIVKRDAHRQRTARRPETVEGPGVIEGARGGGRDAENALRIVDGRSRLAEYGAVFDPQRRSAV